MLIIKRFISFIAALILLLPHEAYADNFDVSAQSFAVMHKGRLLYGKNADRRMPMASTTKLMTAIIAIESCDMNETVTARADCCDIEGSSMYLKAGDTLTVEELVKGLLLVSGNDAAAALAVHTVGSIEGFVELMNEKAAVLGMKNTHFANPHGLSDERHYSTARDLAMLMEYCMGNETFAKINALKSCTVKGLTLANHNRLLYLCRGCKGGKTGYTEKAGRCLVSECERDGIPLVCVTLNAPDDWNDHIALYNSIYAEYEMRNVTEGIRFKVPLISKDTEWAYLVPESVESVLIKRGAKAVLTAKLPWFEFAPVSAGQHCGKVKISVDGEMIGEYYLVYCDSISAMKGKT